MKTKKNNTPRTLPRSLPQELDDAGRSSHPKLVLILESAFVLGFIGLWVALALLSLSPRPVSGHSASVTPPRTAKSGVARYLDGVPVPRGSENRWPIGVMVENLPVVRPQAGLSLAKVVFEAPAESGVTRFLALFDGSEQASRVGPVRSARPYYVDWAEGFDALYAHAGGSPQAYAKVAADSVHDANAIGRAAKYFFRDTSLRAPHNLFTTMANLGRLRHDLGLEDRVPSYTPWTFSPERALADRGIPAQPITVEFSSKSYAVTWSYDRLPNRYVRANGGKVHTDALTGLPINAANVVVIRVGPVTDLGEKGRISFPTLGSGEATVFRDGLVATGTWRKESSRSMLRLFDAKGAELALAPGPTWIEALPIGRPLTY